MEPDPKEPDSAPSWDNVRRLLQTGRSSATEALSHDPFAAAVCERPLSGEVGGGSRPLKRYPQVSKRAHSLSRELQAIAFVQVRYPLAAQLPSAEVGRCAHFLLASEQVAQNALRARQKGMHHLIVFSFFISHFRHTFGIELISRCSRIGHQDGRVSSDEELRVVGNKVVDSRQSGELTLRRQGRFRFIKQIKPFSAESVHQECRERFAVRLFVQGATAIRVGDWRSRRPLCIEMLDLCGDIEETFSSKEEAVLRSAHAFGYPQIVCKVRVRGTSAKVEIPCAPFRIESHRDRDCLKKR